MLIMTQYINIEIPKSLLNLAWIHTDGDQKQNQIRAKALNVFKADQRAVPESLGIPSSSVILLFTLKSPKTICWSLSIMRLLLLYLHKSASCNHLNHFLETDTKASIFQ